MENQNHETKCETRDTSSGAAAMFLFYLAGPRRILKQRGGGGWGGVRPSLPHQHQDKRTTHRTPSPQRRGPRTSPPRWCPGQTDEGEGGAALRSHRPSTYSFLLKRRSARQKSDTGCWVCAAARMARRQKHRLQEKWCERLQLESTQEEEALVSVNPPPPRSLPLSHRSHLLRWSQLITRSLLQTLCCPVREALMIKSCIKVNFPPNASRFFFFFLIRF